MDWFQHLNFTIQGPDTRDKGSNRIQKCNDTGYTDIIQWGKNMIQNTGIQGHKDTGLQGFKNKKTQGYNDTCTPWHRITRI